MKKAFCLITLLSFCMIFVSCAPSKKEFQDSGAKLLNQQDLIELFKVERIGIDKNKRGRSGEIHYFPDGTQKLKYRGGGDEGKYRVENGRFCSKWKGFRNSEEECYQIYRTGENKLVFINLYGPYNKTVTFKK